MFSAPAGIAYNTEVERRFLTTHFSIRAVEEETVGCGVDLPQAQVYQRDKPEEERKDDADAGEAIPDDERRRAGGPTWRAAAASSSAATGCTARWRSTAAGSMPAKAARS